jgi:hypothetical protein
VRQHLPLAEELLAQALLKLECFTGERPGDFALLHALSILQFFFAELQYLLVIQPKRRDADEQKRAQHNPEDAHASRGEVYEFSAGHRNSYL